MSTEPTPVIINADDFGFSPGVRRGIHELFEVGAISSTTIMVAVPDAPAIMREWSVAELRGRAGLHLQLTDGVPLSAPGEVPSLVERDGTFGDPRGRRVNIEEVAREWRRQAEAGFELLKGAPTHIDSHHGIHREPELFEVYLELARELDVPFRGGPQDFIRNAVAGSGLFATTAIVGDWTGTGAGVTALLDRIVAKAAEFPASRAVEVVAHPGYADDLLRRRTSLTEMREYDLADLRALALKGGLEEQGLLLSRFGSIH